MNENPPTVPDETPWPNQQEVPDGVVPADEVPQDMNLVEDDDFDLEMEN